MNVRIALEFNSNHQRVLRVSKSPISKEDSVLYGIGNPGIISASSSAEIAEFHDMLQGVSLLQFYS